MRHKCVRGGIPKKEGGGRGSQEYLGVQRHMKCAVWYGTDQGDKRSFGGSGIPACHLIPLHHIMVCSIAAPRSLGVTCLLFVWQEEKIEVTRTDEKRD
jgi:hypothetical protein